MTEEDVVASQNAHLYVECQLEQVFRSINKTTKKTYKVCYQTIKIPKRKLLFGIIILKKFGMQIINTCSLVKWKLECDQNSEQIFVRYSDDI